MGIFVTYNRWHWRAFNILSRCFGVMAFIVAVAFLAFALYVAVRPAAAAGIETAGLSPSVLYLVVGGLVGTVAVVILRAPPYRPDLGDRTWSLSRRASGPDGARDWWTGDRRA